MFGRMNSGESCHDRGRFFGPGGRGGDRGGRLGRHGRSRGVGRSRSEDGHEGGVGGPRGPFGRGGGGRVFGPGDLRLILLSLIEEKPRHGYELIKALEEKFGGGYAPSPGSVYPTLTLLEELGYLRSAASEGSKRLFEITAAGTRYLRDNDVALNSALVRMEMAARAVAGEAAPRDLHHAMHMLTTALKFHRGGWDDKETRRVTKIIEDAAEAISLRPERD
jgi:DNA-binding PadR family transcriptional regulator